jgi:hypothetical protein
MPEVRVRAFPGHLHEAGNWEQTHPQTGVTELRQAVQYVGTRGRAVAEVAVGAAAMLVGGLIYVCWREPHLRMFGWFEALGISNVVGSVRLASAPLRDGIPAWVVFCLPQALWLLSGLLALHVVWGRRSGSGFRSWALVLVLVALGFECGQLMGVIPGQFDIWDLVLLAFACFTAQGILSFTSTDGGGREHECRHYPATR